MSDSSFGAEEPALMALIQFGWNDDVAASFATVAEPGDVPARVTAVHRNRIVVATNTGERDATLDPRLLNGDSIERPATGDWIALRVDASETSARARVVLPRRTAFIRRTAGSKAEAQVVAANIDRVFVVMALPHDVNVRRLERYLALAWESGAVPAVLLTKCDLVDQAQILRLASLAQDDKGVDEYVRMVRGVAPGVDVIAVSATNDDGIIALQKLITPRSTIALLGSSGVGKSTLVNRLAGREIMRTASVDRDGRGRHTTTHRELVQLGKGVLVIDTPGMREIQLWSADAGLEHVFEDIATLSESCRFSDCRHANEPGCAVIDAVAKGVMSSERLKSWRKLEREAARSQLETDAVAASAERAKLRTLMRSVRVHARAKKDR